MWVKSRNERSRKRSLVIQGKKAREKMSYRIFYTIRFTTTIQEQLTNTNLKCFHLITNLMMIRSITILILASCSLVTTMADKQVRHDSQDVPWHLCRQAATGTFCLGGADKVHHHPGGYGCWRDQSCQVAIVGQMDSVTFNITWNIYYQTNKDNARLFSLLNFNKMADNTAEPKNTFPESVPYVLMFEKSDSDKYCFSTVTVQSVGRSIPCGPGIYDHVKHQINYQAADGKSWSWFQFISGRKFNIDYGPTGENRKYSLDFMTEALQPVFSQRLPQKSGWVQYLRTNHLVDTFRYGNTQVTLEPTTTEAPTTTTEPITTTKEPTSSIESTDSEGASADLGDYDDVSSTESVPSTQETTSESSYPEETTVITTTTPEITEGPTESPTAKSAEPETETPAAGNAAAGKDGQSKSFIWLWLLLLLLPLIGGLIFFLMRQNNSKKEKHRRQVHEASIRNRNSPTNLNKQSNRARPKV
ncbi:hypothetical protein HDE_03916 [Halotydeus destructor]|nr:hypothetical protein HDE_03916 [Halotydeus destructor]